MGSPNPSNPACTMLALTGEAGPCRGNNRKEKRRLAFECGNPTDDPQNPNARIPEDRVVPSCGSLNIGNGGKREERQTRYKVKQLLTAIPRLSPQNCGFKSTIKNPIKPLRSRPPLEQGLRLPKCCTSPCRRRRSTGTTAQL